jgi:hypothetical protein
LGAVTNPARWGCIPRTTHPGSGQSDELSRNFEKPENQWPTIARWKMRLQQDVMAGLEGRHQGSKPCSATPAVQARVTRGVQQNRETAAPAGPVENWRTSWASASPRYSGFWTRRN